MQNITSESRQGIPERHRTMTTDLITINPAPLAAPLDRAAAYAEQSIAPNTRRALAAGWAAFSTWCEQHGLASLPAEPGTLAAYLAALADEGLSVATIEQRLWVISKRHSTSGAPNPTKTEAVHHTMRGIRRTLGSAQTQKAPIVTDVLRVMLGTLDTSRAGLRDRALLLVGFAGAFRRSELVSLTVADLAFNPQGLVITLRRSKTDQQGEGTQRALPYGLSSATCPVRAVRAWLDAAALVSGPLWRPIDRHGNIGPAALTSHAVARLVKRCAAAAGLEPRDFSGHSLRAGLATAAAAAGVSERSIMQQTGHKSERMVRRYIRRGSLFRDNAAGKVGL